MAATATVIQFHPATSPETGSASNREITPAYTGRTADNSGLEAAASTALISARVSDLSTLQDLGNGRVFVHPLYVRLEQQGADEWFAISNDLGLVGEGETDFEAMDSLREQIAELFEALLEMRSTLGSHLEMQLAFLERLAGTR